MVAVYSSEFWDVILEPTGRVIVSCREEAYCSGFVREFNSGFKVPGVRAKMVRSFGPSAVADPRDWHTWDGHQPPRRGEPAYCIVLMIVRRKARWQPRTTDAQVPIAFQKGTLVEWWTKHPAMVRRDVLEFNRLQMVKLRSPKGGVTIWALPAFGVCGFDQTVRTLSMEDVR